MRDSCLILLCNGSENGVPTNSFARYGADFMKTAEMGGGNECSMYVDVEWYIAYKSNKQIGTLPP
jgi:hypothetical protein